MSVQSIFVYGTLKREQCRAGHWPHRPHCIQLAAVDGRLFDLGAYPAMIHGRNRVAGELWSFDEELVNDTLRTLDAIEDFFGEPTDLYRREIVECEAEGESTPLLAYAYYYARPHELDLTTEIQPSADGKCYWPPQHVSQE